MFYGRSNYMHFAHGFKIWHLLISILYKGLSPNQNEIFIKSLIAQEGRFQLSGPIDVSVPGGEIK